MPGGTELGGESFHVVVNHDEQYFDLGGKRESPAGWTDDAVAVELEGAAYLP
jgi:uncharacterized protein YbdZ (MbtH family)